MKQYPSIVPGSKSRPFRAHLFDKPDGRNFRAEFNTKRGWYKFGSRHQMVDANDPVMGRAVALLQGALGQALISKLTAAGHSSGVIFGEFYGESTLAGSNMQSADRLCFFDFSPHGGILTPQDFMRVIADTAETPKYFGVYDWCPSLVEEVRCGKFGVAEGVVGKSENRPPYMAKAKTQTWLDAVRALHGQEWADKHADM